MHFLYELKKMKDWEEMGRFPEVNKLPVNVRVEPFLTFRFWEI